jgi:hypothetical protein
MSVFKLLYKNLYFKFIKFFIANKKILTKVRFFSLREGDLAEMIMLMI